VVRAQGVDDHEQHVELLVIGGGAVVRVAAQDRQERGSGGARCAGLDQPPAAQARFHAAGE
jgi:hypothetical protein